MKQTPMPPRSKPLARRAGLVTRTPLASATRTRPLRTTPTAQKRPAGSGHHEAEFGSLVRLMIRTRAGDGDAENACCEACLIWLGVHGGQIQHIKARGAGGSRDPELGSPVGGALLCGTPESLCHGLCEARDPGMYEAGFWIKFAEVLGAKPIRVGWRTGTWTERWLLADGTYGDEPAERAEPELASKKSEGGVAA